LKREEKGNIKAGREDRIEHKGKIMQGILVKYNVKERDEVEELNTYVHANMKKNIIYYQTLVLYLLLTWFVEVE
jgi:hypothetical protein